MNIIEPKGATQIQNGEELYTDTQYDLYSQGESSGFQIWKLYSLATPRVREQFNKICKDMKQLTAYLDIEKYLTKSNLSMEDQLRTGFDDLTLSDCIFHSSMHSMLQDLQVQSGKQLLQKQLKYILEVRLCPGLPFVVEDNEQVSAQFTEYNLKGSFDSYAIVTPGFYNVTQPQLPVTRHDNSLPFYSKYKIFKRDNYIATKLIIVYFDTQNNDLDADLCQVCLECKIKGVSREGYFTGNQTSQQLNFTPNKATLFCQNDNLRLCGECDQLLHRGVLQRHIRVEIGDQCRLSQCPRHPDEKLAYEDVQTGTFLCTKCVQERTGGSLTGVRSVQQLYADFLADRPGKISINTELQSLYDQQSKLEAVLNNVRAFNTAVEDQLLEYFKGIISQLAAHQNQLVQQLLGQLCLLSRATADLYGQYSFINKQQSNLTANEALAFYRRFDHNRANIKQELSGQTQNVYHFVNGLTSQIERFKQAYMAIPQEHLLNMQMMYGRYQHSRLYGLYSKNTSEVPIYVGQDNAKPDFSIEQQKLADKLKDVHSFFDDINSFKTSGDKYSDQLAMNVFNVVKNNANIFTFNLQDQPIYDQLRATMHQSKSNAAQSIPQAATATETNYQEEEHYPEENLNIEQEKQLSQSVFKNTSILKQSTIDKKKYLDDVYGDNEDDRGLVVHNAVSSHKDYVPVPQATSVSQIFDMASVNQPTQQPPVNTTQQQNIKQSYPILNDPSGSHIPKVEGQLQLQESISPKDRASQAQIPADNINLSTANSQFKNPEYTQRIPEKTLPVVQGEHKTLQTSYDNLQRIYKVAERNQQIPSQYFSEVIDSPKLREMLYFQMAHTLKKERQYQKLKLMPVKRKFDRRRGTKFAAIMEICKGSPCMIIISLHFDTEKKQIALSLCSPLQQGTIQSKYQFLCDLSTLQLEESQDFTFEPREWSYGDTCVIAKDFAGVKYDGKYWTCDAVDVYCFDE